MIKKIFTIQLFLIAGNFLFSGITNASEITGTLSSGVGSGSTVGGTIGGSTGGSGVSGSLGGTVGGGSIGGSVSGGSTGGGSIVSGGGSTLGSVLGASIDIPSSPGFPNTGFMPHSFLFLGLGILSIFSAVLLLIYEFRRA